MDFNVGTVDLNVYKLVKKTKAIWLAVWVHSLKCITILKLVSADILLVQMFFCFFSETQYIKLYSFVLTISLTFELHLGHKFFKIFNFNVMSGAPCVSYKYMTS